MLVKVKHMVDSVILVIVPLTVFVCPGQGLVIVLVMTVVISVVRRMVPVLLTVVLLL
jgi:hypothetical protein